MKSKIKIKGQEEREHKKINYSLFSFKQFMFMFLIFGFVVAASFFLFFHDGIMVILDETDFELGFMRRVRFSFFNILFLSLIMSVLNNIIKVFTIKIPVMKILEATRKITEGDFSARIELKRPFGTVNEFDVIIEDFNKMAQELSSIETLKTDFVSNVSHELKTPLSVIQNYSTLLLNSELNQEEINECAKVLSDASSNLSGLISNILRLNRLENQEIFPEKKKVNLSEQICECMLYFEKEWEEKKLKIETDFDGELVVNGDVELLSIVWSNLISNAVKFSDEGDTVSLCVKKEGTCAVVVISDTGCGMSADVTRRIFEKFYQGDPSRATKGNGLGLAMVKRVIDIIDGEIEVESEEGTGTVFTVRIPV